MALSIVVVDDSEDNADMLAELLRQDGHRVRVAYHGPGALALLEEELPQTVLVDIGLPGMDGYEVAAQARERFGWGLRLVALTGFSGSEPRDRARQAGFDAFLVKPLLAEDVHKALRRSPG